MILFLSLALVRSSARMRSSLSCKKRREREGDTLGLYGDFSPPALMWQGEKEEVSGKKENEEKTGEGEGERRDGEKRR